MEKRSITKALMGRVWGLLIFFILVIAANIAISYVSNDIYRQAVMFLNTNILFLLGITIVLTIGEVFGLLIFPLNLIGPIFNALGAVLITAFLVRVLNLVDSFVPADIVGHIYYFIPLIYVIVFLIALIGGFVKIFVKTGKQGYDQDVKKSRAHGNKKIEWSDVEVEFREAFFELGRLIKNSIRKKRNIKA